MKEKIVSALILIPATVVSTAFLVALRFGLAFATIPLENIMSNLTIAILFWGLQGIVVVGTIIYFLSKKQYVLAISVIFGFILSFGLGPMN